VPAGWCNATVKSLGSAAFTIALVGSAKGPPSARVGFEEPATIWPTDCGLTFFPR